MNKRLISLSLFLTLSGAFQLVRGVPFADLYLRWWFIVICVILSFFIDDNFEDKVYSFFAHAISVMVITIIKILPTEYATKKRSRAYSNYHNGKQDE